MTTCRLLCGLLFYKKKGDSLVLKKYISTIWKGIVIGGTMLVPGMSGGSMAMILGIYDKLISAVSNFFKDIKKHFLFLLVFCVAAVTGMILFSNPLLSLINTFTMPAMYFFIGAIAGGIPMIGRQAQVKKFSWKLPVYIILGALAVWILSVLPTSSTDTESSGFFGSVMLVIAGIIAAVALILPGISVSYLLLVLNLYEETVKAISTLYFPFLIPLAIGFAAGIILTTKLLEMAMERHPQPTYLIILGFMLGAVVNVFPGIPSLWEIPVCIVTCAAGFAIIYLISKKEAAAS